MGDGACQWTSTFLLAFLGPKKTSQKKGHLQKAKVLKGKLAGILLCGHHAWHPNIKRDHLATQCGFSALARQCQ